MSTIRSKQGLDGRVYLVEATPDPNAYTKPLHPNVRALFVDLVKVSIPEIEKYSDDEIRYRGMFVSSEGEEEELEQMLYNFTEVYRTINDIFELWRRGVEVYIPMEEIPKVYRAVSNHIESWINFIKYEVHNQGAPFDDLFLLDQFASELYETAKYFEQQILVDNPFQVKNELGIELGAGFFLGKKKGARFRHLFKSDYEKRLESGNLTPSTLSRSDFQEELARMASVYDLRPQEAARKSARSQK